MGEAWKKRGELLQELDALRDRIAQLEQDRDGMKNEQVEQSDDVFKSTFDNATEGVLLIDLKTKRPVAGNKAMCEMLGCRGEGIESLRLEDVYPQEASGHIVEQAQAQLDGKPSFTYNVPITKHDGGILFADVTLVPFTLADSKYIMSVFRDASTKTRQTRQQDRAEDSLENLHLTATEIKVLKLIVKGMSSKEIAHLLHRSSRTVENHRAHLMKKLGVYNSIELVRRAIKLGLLNLPTGLQQESPP